MSRFIQLTSYFSAVLIVAGAAICAWALVESGRPSVSSEILMAIPGTSFMMMPTGLVLGICLIIARRKMARAELVILSVFAALGLGLLPVLILSGF